MLFFRMGKYIGDEVSPKNKELSKFVQRLPESVLLSFKPGLKLFVSLYNNL